MSMKNSSDTLRNRIRDLPACSAVLQPTARREGIGGGGGGSRGVALFILKVSARWE